ncbi:hypothetical protein BN2476_720014 [Paraburkholderia piptadeniae]|uniref:Uncharacterized protein n=1 Tax=Paraburkholderia piptadeniae TaxID=1701573 RepID=A0A1N7SR42_9BURK|nr:hypothetical protein BN2476_720014 [Paraburkholderia piptadeniae]
MQRAAAPFVRRQGATTRGACVFARAQVAAFAAAGGHQKQNVRFCLCYMAASKGRALKRSRREQDWNCNWYYGRTQASRPRKPA